MECKKKKSLESAKVIKREKFCCLLFDIPTTYAWLGEKREKVSTSVSVKCIYERNKIYIEL